ncbi:hypothetical protein Q9233_004782 [Columba guinea]|nr:hypothetical protein Q9233_004782 [Columba guinea]
MGRSVLLSTALSVFPACLRFLADCVDRTLVAIAHDSMAGEGFYGHTSWPPASTSSQKGTKDVSHMAVDCPAMGGPLKTPSDFYVPSSCNLVVTQGCDLYAIRYVLAAISMAAAWSWADNSGGVNLHLTEARSQWFFLGLSTIPRKAVFPGESKAASASRTLQEIWFFILKQLIDLLVLEVLSTCSMLCLCPGF